MKTKSFANMVTRENKVNIRRRAIEVAQDKLGTFSFHDDKALTEDEQYAVLELLTDVLHGHDARQLIGITPRLGPRLHSKRPNFIMECTTGRYGTAKKNSG